MTIEQLETRLTPTLLAASSFFDSAIYEFDANTGALAATLVAPNSSSLLLGPAGLTVGPDNNLYISSQFNNAILEYNLSTNTLSTFISSSVLAPIAATVGAPSFAPAALRFGPDGNLYVDLNGGQSSSTGAVVRFNISSTGGVLSLSGTDSVVDTTGLVQPTGLAFGPTGDTGSLYVSSSGTDTVVKIANATGASPTASTFITGPGAGNLNYPSGLTWGADGKLYVVDLGATSFQGQVLRYNANGSFDEVYAQPNGSGQGSLLFQFPSDLVFDTQGRLDVANLGPSSSSPYQGSIDQYSSTTGVFSAALVTSSEFSSGIAASQLALLAPPTITSVNNAAFTLDAAGSFTVTATSAATPTFFSETGALPAGVTFTTAGVLSGTPTQLGSFPIVIKASSDDGSTSQTFTLTVDPGLFTTSFFNSAIYEFDANTGALAATLVAPNSSSLLLGPAGLTVGPDNNLYISSQFNNAILEYNLSTNTLSTFISSSVLAPIAATVGAPSFAPAALRFGPDGNLYVDLNGGQSSSTGAVVRFNISSTGGVLSFSGTDSVVDTAGLIQPTGLAFGPTGDAGSLYVSSSGIDTVVKIANATGASPTASTFISGPGAGNLNYPSGLTWGADGKLYVVDLGATSFQGQILRYNANGSFDEVYAQPNGGGQGSLLFQFPSDLVFDAQGRLDVANLGPSSSSPYQGSIDQYSSTTGVFSAALVTSSEFSSGIAASQLALLLAKTTTTLTDNGPNPSYAGENVTFTVTVSPSVPNGETVTLEDASNGYASVGSGTLTGGTVMINVTSLSLGSHHIIAVYGGDTTHASSQSSQVVQVVNTAVTLSLVDINSDAANTALYDGGIQRSMVDSVVYHFNTAVNLDASAITITLHSGVIVTLGNGSQTSGTVGTVPNATTWASPDGGFTWVVAFGGAGVTGGGSIADGVYDITLNAAHITTAGGGAVTLNNFQGGTGSETDTFWSLFGDANQDKKVTAQDYGAFASTYLVRSNSSGYIAWFDQQGDDKVTAQDYGAFAGNYLKKYSGFTATI